MQKPSKALDKFLGLRISAGRAQRSLLKRGYTIIRELRTDNGAVTHWGGMGLERSRVLYCDYDEDFTTAEEISTAGYLVDQVKPAALRAVGVEEHGLYIFSFGNPERTSEVLRVCERLKSAELSTPILLFCRGTATEEFKAHAKKKKAADYYVSEPNSYSTLLEVLRAIVGEPAQPETVVDQVLPQPFTGPITEEIKPTSEATPLPTIDGGDWKNKADEWKSRFEELEKRIDSIQEEERKKTQTEVEKLKVELSEQEAKLLDREAKHRDLEISHRQTQSKLQKIEEAHEKTLRSLREFYQAKLRELQLQLGLSANDVIHDTEPQSISEFEENTILLKEDSISQTQKISQSTEEILPPEDSLASRSRPR